MELQQEIMGSSGGNGVHIKLADHDQIRLLSSKTIVAFRGDASRREDRFLNLKGMYRKRKLICSDISGPSELVLSLPAGHHLKALELENGTNLLFDMRSVLYYSSGITLKNVLLKIKNMVVSQDFTKIKFSGAGTVGILSRGPLYEMALDPVTPVYVDSRCLVAYPEGAKVDLCVYGNHLASQHMNYQWELRGEGNILLQTGTTDREMEAEMSGDGIIKRVLREVIPFGGVFIK